MSTPHDPKDIEFGGPAVYRIVVQGTLDNDWSSRLGGMRITVTDRVGRTPHTTLEGPIRDQAALNGILEALYGLHMTILKVETLDEHGEPQ